MFLPLDDLSDVRGTVRSDQAPNSVFRQIRIGLAEEYGDVVGVGRQVGKRGIGRTV